MTLNYNNHKNWFYIIYKLYPIHYSGLTQLEKPVDYTFDSSIITTEKVDHILSDNRVSFE
jgi:hypothetical protein